MLAQTPLLSTCCVSTQPVAPLRSGAAAATLSWFLPWLQDAAEAAAAAGPAGPGHGRQVALQFRQVHQHATEDAGGQVEGEGEQF